MDQLRFRVGHNLFRKAWERTKQLDGFGERFRLLEQMQRQEHIEESGQSVGSPFWKEYATGTSSNSSFDPG
jgi:hypothetical protein